MTKTTLPSGRELVYDTPPSGSGWTEGRIATVEVRVYIRPEDQGSGVFVDHDDGNGLVAADTGEKTVWFNNRLWTLTEEKEEMERIREAAND